jgi:hypothetical protein
LLSAAAAADLAADDPDDSSHDPEAAQKLDGPGVRISVLTAGSTAYMDLTTGKNLLSRIRMRIVSRFST